MYIIDGIAYAGEISKPIRARSVRPLDHYKLLVTFNNDEKRIFNFKPYLNMPCYKPLNDINVFDRVYVDYGTAVWNDGAIDIAPETLFEESIPFSEEDTV